MVLDITLIIVGPQLVTLEYFCFIPIQFTLIITDWIANTETGLDHNDSVKEVVVYNASPLKSWFKDKNYKQTHLIFLPLIF